MESYENLWSKLGSQIEILVPSAYAGITFVVIAIYFNAQGTRSLIENIGSVLIAPSVLFLGLLFYLIYRAILGEFLLYPLRHLLLLPADYLWRSARHKPEEFLSFTRLLAERKVGFGFRRQVYSSIRDVEGVFDQSLRDRFDLLHATYHFFYISSLELLGAGAYAWYHSGFESKPFFQAGIALLILAFIADFRQDIWECRLLRTKANEIDALLVRIGYKTSPTGQPMD